MGQARNRGSYEQRRAEAIAKRNDEIAASKDAQAKRLASLPSRCPRNRVGAFATITAMFGIDWR